MRIRDIVPIRTEVTKVALVGIGPDHWEIHFWIGEEEFNHIVSMHWPSGTARKWKDLNNALNIAKEIFFLKEYMVIIKY